MDENTPKPPASHDSVSPANRALYGAPPPNLRGTRKRTLGTYVWPIAILVVVGIGVMYVVGHNGDGGSAQPQGGRRGAANGYTPVNAVQATLGDMPIYLDALGTVTPEATVTVRSQINGVLQSVAFTEGQMVQKGQFLAQVDPRPYQAALLQAQGALAKDQATLAEARKDLARYKTLIAQDSISQQTLDTQQSTVDQLVGTVQSDQAAVQTQQLNLVYAHITAPLSGRVGLRQVDPGNFVTSGDTNGIVAITEQSPIDVAFTIPEDQVQTVIARFKNGETKLPVSVLDRTQSKTLATGTLLSLDNLIDTTTGTLRAKARFTNSDGSLFPSQFVNVRVLVDTMHNVVVVPSSAILRGQQGLFVYVANARGAVHVTPVTTGPTDGDNTAILSGVSPGQEVVTDGTDRLREGACVVLPSQSGGAGGYGGHHHGGAGASGANASAAPKEGFFGHLFSGSSSSAAAGGKAKSASPCGGGSGGHHGASSAGAGDQTAQAGTEGTSAGTPAASGYQGSATSGQASAGGWHHNGGQSGGQSGGMSGDTGTPAVASGTPAAGQAGSWHGGQGGGGGRMAALLQQLDLTPDQQSKANAIMAQARQQAQAADDPDAKRQIFMASQQQIQAILTPEQKTKLQQLRAAQKAQQQQGGDQGAQGQQQ